MPTSWDDQRCSKKSLKIPKWQAEVVNRRWTDNKWPTYE